MSKLLEKNVHTYITEDELRYYCSGMRRIVQPIKNNKGDIIDFVDVVLDEMDLENMIKYMKDMNLIFSLQVFKVVQEEYIISKNKNMRNSENDIVIKPYTRSLNCVRA